MQLQFVNKTRNSFMSTFFFQNIEFDFYWYTIYTWEQSCAYTVNRDDKFNHQKFFL